MEVRTKKLLVSFRTVYSPICAANRQKKLGEVSPNFFTKLFVLPTLKLTKLLLVIILLLMTSFKSPGAHKLQNWQ